MHAFKALTALPAVSVFQEVGSSSQIYDFAETGVSRKQGVYSKLVSSSRLTARRKIGVALVAAGACLGAAAHAADSVVFKPNPDPAFPIAISVEVPASASLVHLSGQVPPLVDPRHPADSPLAYGGDTRAQSFATLALIQSLLEAEGLTMGDVVKMQVYLVADPHRDNQMDFAGFSQAYAEFFGTAMQPNVPARSTFQVAGLLNPGWLVEIEVVAART